MEIVTPALMSAPVKAAEVNCEPWSVLKISGLARSSASVPMYGATLALKSAPARRCRELQA
jgi:hypothetical protein